MNAHRVDIIDAKGSKLQDIMDERGLTMSAISRMAGVSIPVIKKLRDGLTLRREKFFAVVHCLKVQPEKIVPSWDKIKKDG